MAEIIKSPNDKLNYKFLILENKMKCLIISDPDADKSAAALDVHVGSALDPKMFEG